MHMCTDIQADKTTKHTKKMIYANSPMIQCTNYFLFRCLDVGISALKSYSIETDRELGSPTIMILNTAKRIS